MTKIVDLSHPIENGMITYTGLPGPKILSLSPRVITSEFWGLIKKHGDEFGDNYMSFIDWYANILSDPRVTIHVKYPESFDVHTEASVVADGDFRRRFFAAREPAWYRSQVELDRLVASAPMISLAPVTV